MKFYTQDGKNLKRTYLHESGNVCACCEDFLHGSAENDEHQNLPDDAECKECHSLCSCSCHRPKKD